MAKILKNMKISSKLSMVLVIVISGFVFFAWYGFTTLNYIKVTGPIYKEIVQGKDLLADILPPPEYIIESYLVMYELKQKMDDPEEVEKLEKYLLNDLKQTYYDRQNYWLNDNILLSKETKMKTNLVTDSKKPVDEFYDIMEKEYIPAIKSKDKIKIDALINDKLKNLYADHRKYIDSLVVLANELTAKTEDFTNSAIKSKTLVMACVAVGAIVISLTIFIVVLSQILSSLRKTLKMMKDISEGEGDLTRRIEVETNDELGEFANYFNKFLNQLRIMIKDVSEASYKIATGSSQMGSSATKMSRGAQELAVTTQETTASVTQLNKSLQEVLKNIDQQTSAVSETSCAIEQMTRNIDEVLRNIQDQASSVNQSTASVEELVTSIQQVAENADKVNKLAKDVNNKSGDGNKAVTEAIEGMKEITKSAQQINNIIGVITGIASQTNLLALNAAIEAARAGDAGKGFAVVADEVRNLAEQSAQAAKEITLLIKDSNDKAEKGVKLVENMEGIINEISKSAQEVTNLSEEVGLSTSEQQKGSQEIAQAMEKLNSITHSILNSMEEQSKGANEISKAMQNLTKIAEEISTATTEQASGTDQINRTVEQVNSVAEENEAGSKQCVSVSDELLQQSDILDKLVNKFKI